MAEVKVKIGKKADKGKADPAKTGKGQKPQPQDVEGQYAYTDWYVCPYCYANNHIIVESTRWQYYTCWNCYGTFEA
jgi:hypothetical protein